MRARLALEHFSDNLFFLCWLLAIWLGLLVGTVEDDHAYFNEISPSDFNVQNQRYDQEFYKQMPATTKNGSNGKQFQTLGEGGNPQAASYNLFKTTNKQLVGNLTQQDESKESITIDPKADKNQFTYKTLDQQKSANAKKKAKDIQRGNYVFESGSSIPSSSNIRSNQAHHHLPPSQQQPKEELIGQLPVEDDKEGMRNFYPTPLSPPAPMPKSCARLRTEQCLSFDQALPFAC